jgi:hypothetical protein
MGDSAESVLNECKNRMACIDVKKSEEVLAGVSALVSEHKRRYLDSVRYLGDSSELSGDVLAHFNETKSKFVSIIGDCEAWEATRDGLVTYVADTPCIDEDMRKLVRKDLVHLVINAGALCEKSLMSYELTLNILKKM